MRCIGRVVATLARPVAVVSRSRSRRAVLAGLLVVAASCGGGETPTTGVGDAPARMAVPDPLDSPVGVPSAGGSIPAAETSAPRLPAMPEALTSPEHERYQQLRVEALRLMIQAAQRALPIGPFQQRMDAASRAALQDVSEAADRMDEIIAELQQAITDDG